MQAKKEICPIDLRDARIAMIRRGTSLNHWALTHGFSMAYVHMTLTGKRSGPKSKKIVSELLSEIQSINEDIGL